MTCQECQTELFDDAPGREALLHVAECEGCRTLSREIRANAEALAALRGEEFAARPFVRPRPFRPAMWALAAAAGLVLAAGLPRFFDREVVVAPLVTQSAPEITKRTQEVAVAPRERAPEARRPTPRAKARPTPAVVLPVEEPAQPLLVKMLTPDPDVVIYWLIDPVEGEKAI